MKPFFAFEPVASPLDRVANYGRSFRDIPRSLHPTQTAGELREGFLKPLAAEGIPGDQVIEELIAAAEPGLVGVTDPNFYAWVMGASDPIGVAADWLTSIWGQNAAFYQTSPAAAIAEEAVSAWLLDLLDLPREASVGLVTGASMAAFVGLAAARAEVLSRAGHSLETDGLQGAPLVHVYFSEDVHVTNLAALRHLGFGERNFHAVAADGEGLMQLEALRAAMASDKGPKIVIAQAGHINSGGFEDISAIAELVRAHNGWLHIDGAFGLWARVLAEKAPLTRGIDLADSWSVDGHKWLQIPYDSGFAIVRNARAHARVMDVSAGYLNTSPEDGRNPSTFNPELSRRARGFAAWAVLRHHGRAGIERLVRGHCDTAAALAEDLGQIPGLKVVNTVALNQIALAPTVPDDEKVRDLAERLNDMGNIFVRTCDWRGRLVLRLSVISAHTGKDETGRLTETIRSIWLDLTGD